jgi:acyl-coenzyme A synthetase/AMP-(fatty) acid ligase
VWRACSQASTSILLLCSAGACSSTTLAPDIDLDWREAMAEASPRPVVRRRPVAVYVLHTSGTIAQPKGGDAYNV